MSATRNDPSTTERPRVYTGRSVEELIPRIERELGHDAIVTRQRSGLGGGVAGFFQRPFVEIEAQPGHPRIDLYDDPGAPAAPLPAPAPAPALARAAASAPATLDALAPSPTRPSPLPPPAATLNRFAAALADAQATAQVASEPQLLAPLPEAPPAPAPALSAPVAPTPSAPARSARRAKKRSPQRAGEAAELRSKLLGRGLDAEFADELIGLASAHGLALAARGATLADAAAAVLRGRIPAAAQWPATGACVAVVGPGGSGKTSLCAALASGYRERSALAVACATVLPGGAAAADEPTLLLSPQLLSPTPVGDERAVAALAQARGEGMLLLDTPSTPVADRAAIARVAALLERLRPDAVVLALPATFGARAGAQLLRAMRPLRPSAIAITHAQETDQLGAAVQAACAAGIAPALLLDQRRDGGGLLRTDPSDLAERLLG